jgi:hypothetical protein
VTKQIVFAAVILAAIIGAFILTGGAPPPSPNAPGTFSFAVLGDAPYYFWEDLQFRLVLRAIDKHELTEVIHVGDIFWNPCSDAMYRMVRNRFNRLRHPVIYTPGDNEWSDCWEAQSGGYAPLERLATLRRMFFADPSHSLGRKRIALTSQSGEFVENVRWRHDGLLFATIHLTGNGNAMKPFPTRTAADDAEAQRRMNAAVAWVRATFAEAGNATAVVIAFHANLDDGRPYLPFINALEEEAARFRRPVLIVHGDDHRFTVDHPLRARNITRMMVPGSHDVGWVRVIVRPGAASPFAFESHIVPRWKYW